MKIKQGKAVAAYRAITNLSREPMELATSLALFRIKKKLAEAEEFQTERQEILIKECNGKAEGAVVTFGKDEAGRRDQQRFLDGLYQLSQLEQEYDIEPLTIRCDGLKISVEELEVLEGIVGFEA